MKKTIVLVALILLSVVSIAQIKFGVRGGMTLSSYNSAQVFYKFKPGVHIGGVADIPLGSSKFSFVSAKANPIDETDKAKLNDIILNNFFLIIITSF